MGYPRTLVTEPAEEPFTLDEAKTHLRVDSSSDDTYITGLITAARLHVEQVTGRALISQQWDVYPQGWPCDDVIPLPLGRLLSVDAFEYTSSGLVTTSWTTTGTNLTSAGAIVAHIDKASDWGGNIVRPFAAIWPAVPLKTSNPIRARITVGYGAAADVPQPLKQYMLLKLGDMYENRESAQTGTAQTVIVLPFAESLIANYRI